MARRAHAERPRLPRFRPVLRALEVRDAPAVLTVTNLSDHDPGSLRDELALANDSDTLQFDPALSGGTITLTSGELELRHRLTLAGPGPELLAVSGNQASRVFEVFAGATVALSGLTVQNGKGSGGAGGGGVLVDAEATLTLTACTLSHNYVGPIPGGGIANTGTLALTDCTITDNVSDGVGGGGGIFNTGTLTLTACTLSGNNATYSGGGIDNSGTLTVTACTLTDNSTYDGGGGIANSGAGTVTACAFTADGASYGGGIANSGTLTVIGCTFSENFSSGIDNAGTLTVTACTLTNNSALNLGGGIDNYAGALTVTACTIVGNWSYLYGGGGIANDGTLRLFDTIVAGNTLDFGSPSDLGGGRGADAASAANLIGTGGSGGLVGGVNGNLVGVADAGLGILGDYGGPTQTIPLLAGSPALNVGDPGQLGTADQRGVVRSGGVNIGAYQASASYFDVSTPASVTAGAPFSVTVTARDLYGQVAVGYTGTVYLGSSDPLAPYLDAFALGPADGGTHPFDGEVLYTTGPQDVYAADGTLFGDAPVAVN